MKFIKPSESSIKINEMIMCGDSFYHITFKIGLCRLQSGHIFNGNLHHCYGRFL